MTTTLTNSLDGVTSRGVGSRRDTGDALSGDGIERVLAEQGHLAPRGGEGGSALRTLGSKEEKARARAERRKAKKEAYARYLETATWKKIRRAALNRDKHTCRACKGRAQVVHHVRYPKSLGEERLEWLYSLCAPCHDEIHRLAANTTLRKATEQVLGLPPKKKSKPRKQKLKVLERTGTFIGGRGPEKRPSKRVALTHDNDRLHEFFKANREKRQRRAA